MTLRTVILSLFLAAGAQDKKDDDKKEEQAKAKIAEFKKELKTCKKTTDVAGAIKNLGNGLQHPKILAELKAWLGKEPDIAEAAAEQIGRYKKDKDAAEALLGAASATANRKETFAVAAACLRAAGEVACKGMGSRFSSFFRNKEVNVARAAVEACGKHHSRETVENLLALGRDLDSVREDTNVVAPLPGVGRVGEDEQVKRKRSLLPAVLSALAEATRERHGAIKEWEAWWRKNKGTFKEED